MIWMIRDDTDDTDDTAHHTIPIEGEARRHNHSLKKKFGIIYFRRVLLYTSLRGLEQAVAISIFQS